MPPGHRQAFHQFQQQEGFEEFADFLSHGHLSPD
jgi:hypothetical protein